ncbi:translation initiation factor eIF-2B subunit eif2b1 [Acrasis kona]|uniref:Translation initiation factor eIF2B subunit alpha n=1 Tax=Acrasis kona TaxID=1008807 RepID=A0AAW2ZC39_9EUKA
MKKEELTNLVKDVVRDNQDMSLSFVAITVLTDVIKRSTSKTMMELDTELKLAVQDLKSCVKEEIEGTDTYRGSSITLHSGCELFTRFVTRQFLEMKEFGAIKSKLTEKGQYISKLSALSREKVTELFEPFFRDNMCVMVVGNSRVATATLIRASRSGKRFSVIIPESRPDVEGYKSARHLRDAGIPVTLIVDSAVAYHMGKVDFVLSGAEAVVESGGIINKIGTYQIAVLAHVHKKSFYVAAESFKFVRQYPLNQNDISGDDHYEHINPPPYTFIDDGQIKDGHDVSDEQERRQLGGIKVSNPTSDFTPPRYITLLFTDLGILTPSAISDELIKLYS